jgi:hypothetical protein
MQSLGTGTQSASGISAGFSNRPDPSPKKVGIGSNRTLGGSDKGIYKTSEIGPFDDPINRLEDEDEYEFDEEYDDFEIGDIDGARMATDSLSRIGPKSQTNQLGAGGIGSYGGAAGPIGNHVSESKQIENLLEGFIREVLKENSIAKSVSFSPYATFRNGPGSYQSKLQMQNPKNKKMKPFRQTNVIHQNMNANGAIQHNFDKRPRTGEPKAFTGGKVIELMQNNLYPDERHIISQEERDEGGIGFSTWELYNRSQEEKAWDNVEKHRNVEKTNKNNKKK